MTASVALVRMVIASLATIRAWICTSQEEEEDLPWIIITIILEDLSLAVRDIIISLATTPALAIIVITRIRWCLIVMEIRLVIINLLKTPTTAAMACRITTIISRVEEVKSSSLSLRWPLSKLKSFVKSVSKDLALLSQRNRPRLAVKQIKMTKRSRLKNYKWDVSTGLSVTKPMLNANMCILKRSANSSLSAVMATNAFTFILRSCVNTVTLVLEWTVPISTVGKTRRKVCPKIWCIWNHG